jgi:hypothetical protein
MDENIVPCSRMSGNKRSIPRAARATTFSCLHARYKLSNRAHIGGPYKAVLDVTNRFNRGYYQPLSDQTDHCLTIKRNDTYARNALKNSMIRE